MLTFRLIFLSCLCLHLLPLEALARESYLSSGVTVSKTASNSTEARRRAVSEAEQQAFKEVAARAFPQYKEALEGKQPDPKMASAAVTEISINRETVTDRHYGGEFAIRFNPALMKEILRREYGAKAPAAATAPAKTAAAGQVKVTTLSAAPQASTTVMQAPPAAAKAPAAAPAVKAAEVKTPEMKAPEKPVEKAEQPKPGPKLTAVQPITQQAQKPKQETKTENAAIKLPSVLPAKTPAPAARPAQAAAVPAAQQPSFARPAPAARPVDFAEKIPLPAPTPPAPVVAKTLPRTAPAPQRIASLPEVTVLPVLEQSEQAIQWDHENPWLSSWRKISQENGSFALPDNGAPVLHPLMLSFIDKRELQEIDRKLIQEGYPGSRAGGKLFIAVGRYFYSPDDKKPVIETKLYELSPHFTPGATTKVAKREGEPLEALAERAARDAYAALSAGLKAGGSTSAAAEPEKTEETSESPDVTAPGAETPQAAPQEEAPANANAAGTGCAGESVTEKLRAEAPELHEWLSVEKRLRSAEGVTSVRPLRLSPGNMQVEITHTCDPAALAASLVAAGLPYHAETHTIAPGTLPPEEKQPEAF